MENSRSDSLRICIVMGHEPSRSETFLRAHIERLPADVHVAYGHLPVLDGKTVRSGAIGARAIRKLRRIMRGAVWQSEVTDGYLRAFARCRPDAVLVEYGDNAVWLREPCVRAGIPLVAHFHGYDASEDRCLRDMAQQYPLLFRDARAIIAVSSTMRARLIQMGAPPEKVHCNCCGVDCDRFGGSTPEKAAPIAIAVGRFVPKKAPHLTLNAFSKVLTVCPDARLRMVGFGPMLESCKVLVRELGIETAVTFLGAAAPDIVQEEMRRARLFVQHSMTAPNGDAEGTPVAVIEAGASGLPVVATRHGGIPDVVVEGSTGLLVDEGDVDGMARQMLRLLEDPEIAGKLGRAARSRVEAAFSMDASIGKLYGIIRDCVHGAPVLQRA